MKHLLNLTSTVTGCASISSFASLVGIHVVIASSAIGLKICAIFAGIKKHRSIIKKKKRKHGKTVLLAKTKLSRIKILICKALIESYISHD